MQRTLRAGFAVAALTLIPAVDAVGASYGSRTLRQGMSGSDVNALQRYLDRAGYETSADGAFGPATAGSVRDFEVAEQRRANGAASRYEQQLVRTRAGEAGEVEDAGEEATLDSEGLAVAPVSAPEEVRAIIDAGNEIATKPYKYGGGHGRWRDSGYDCSGSISYALHGAGLLDTALHSSGFTSWGDRGRGTWVTIWANAGHAYMTVAGLRFDTSARTRAGNRWSETGRSTRGYTATHPEGL